MIKTDDNLLHRATAALFPSTMAVSLIPLSGFKGGLIGSEVIAVEHAAPVRRREYAAGRTAARSALALLGSPPQPIARGPMGAPHWPNGYVGSITHCADFACAVVGGRSDVAAVGIDAEGAGALEDGLVEMICRPDERLHFSKLPSASFVNWSKLVFSIKEAIYKCSFPLTRSYVDFMELSVRITPDTAGRGGSCYLAGARPDLAAALAGLQCRWAVQNGYILCGAWLPSDRRQVNTEMPLQDDIKRFSRQFTMSDHHRVATSASDHPNARSPTPSNGPCKPGQKLPSSPKG